MGVLLMSHLTIELEGEILAWKRQLSRVVAGIEAGDNDASRVAARVAAYYWSSSSKISPSVGSLPFFPAFFFFSAFFSPGCSGAL